MWAMMPMLRYRSRGTFWAIVCSLFASWRIHATTGRAQRSCPVGGGRTRGVWPPVRFGGLPAVVGERLVGVRHLVNVFPTLHRSADAVARVEQLVGETLRHRLLPAL